jgi:hypothetical protein
MIKKKPFNLIIEGLLVATINFIIMQLDKYELEISATKHTFHFISQGQRDILKRIEYAPISNPIDYGLPDGVELYNLGFGDVIFNSETGEKIVSDSERSNNGDKLKVLNTVANTVLLFFENHPNSFIYVEGSSQSRNREYRIGINKIYETISNTFEIAGLIVDEDNMYWEDYEPNGNYYAFLVKKK